MPIRRGRKKRVRHSPYGRTIASPAFGDLKIEAMFDRAKGARPLRSAPLLSHYTNWEAAENIIASQKFRATGHNSTNDPAELASADATILEAINAALTLATGIPRRL